MVGLRSIFERLLITTYSEPRSLPVFDTMTHLIARISNRVVFGTELCRNKNFLHAVVQFAETVTIIAPFVHWSPPLLRRSLAPWNCEVCSDVSTLLSGSSILRCRRS